MPQRWRRMHPLLGGPAHGRCQPTPRLFHKTPRPDTRRKCHPDLRRPTAGITHRTSNPIPFPTKTCRGSVGFMWVLGEPTHGYYQPTHRLFYDTALPGVGCKCRHCFCRPALLCRVFFYAIDLALYFSSKSQLEPLDTPVRNWLPSITH
jgi:hypothetical protein